MAAWLLAPGPSLLAIVRGMPVPAPSTASSASSAGPWAARDAGDGGPFVAGRAAATVFVANLPFAAIALLCVVGLTIYDRSSVQSPAFLGGVVVLAVAVAVTLLVPWQRVPARAEVVVPLLDLLATGLFVASGAYLTLLAVFPVLWLAQRHGRTGQTLAIVGGFAVAWVPTALSPHDVTPAEVPRVVLVPVVLTAVALSIGAIQRRSDARNLLLRRQGAQLRRAAGDLGAERRLLEAVVSTAGVGIVLLDERGVVVLANRLATEATDGALRPGAALADLPDLRPTRLDGTPVRPGPVDRAVAGEELAGDVAWWPLPAGRLALRTSVTQIEGDRPGERDGERRVAVVTFEDLTEQVTALDLKEDFVAAASHELRTPLTSIVGHLELAADDPTTPPRVREHVDVAVRNADRLLHLVDGLLTAAATRDGVLTLQRADVDLAPLAAEALAAIAPVAVAAGVVLPASPSVLGDVRVRGDRTRLRQVLDNLLSNAVKYSDAGGAVEVGLAREGEEVVLRVADRGVGIAAADLGRVFSRFYRAGAVRHGPRHGTGLGLHITQEVVAAHGGRIALRSAAGEGTEAVVRLPAGGAA